LDLWKLEIEAQGDFTEESDNSKEDHLEPQLQGKTR